MLYKVESGKSLRESNDSIDAVKEFKNVEDEILRFCFLLVDYRSPHRLLPKSLRIKSILTELNYNTTIKRKNFLNKHEDCIATVCKKYESLQFSPQHELLKGAKAQIAQWTELMMDTDKEGRDSDMAFKVFKEMDSLVARLKVLEEEVGDIQIDDDDKEDWTALERYND